ncbi:hypothetical protein HGA92_00845 [Candidatus Gracilibacteria bacterium]|nr:hypothetical protein [Candidatus Gracilibacteria bacterium]NUJ98843.1 hypothetical protein [Candidatus Gracilibacteria bacterium]
MNSIKELEISELKNLLVGIREYMDLKKKLGKRGAKYFKKNILGKKDYIVEYYPSLSKQVVLDEALRIFESVFNENPQKEEIVLIAKENLGGGIKIYRDDELIDISFSNIEKKIRK